MFEDDADTRVLAELLDSLNIALCLFGPDDRQLLWNRTFLRLFPEHDGQIHPGEPYRENLRRFYRARLAPDELPRIEHYIDTAVQRHRQQQRPYTFQHRGLWLRVASLPLAQGRVRIWTPVARPPGAYERGDADAVTLIDQMADGVTVLDADDRISAVNDAFVPLYGLPDKAAALGRRFDALYRALWDDETRRAEAAERGVAAIAERLRFSGAPLELPLPGGRWVRVIEHRNRDGIAYCVHADISALMHQQQDLLAAERRLRRSEERYRLLAENSSDAILSIDTDLVIRYASPAVQDSFGWAPAQLVGHALAELLHPEDCAPFIVRHFTQSARHGGPEMFRALHREGHIVWVEARVQPLGDGAGFVCNLRDATQRRRTEDALASANSELATLAATDALTGLANRRQFDATLNKEWYRSLREHTPLALLIIDVDHFKALNDLFGHQVGDAFLARVARTIRDNVRRAGDLAARYGGEEFAVILPHTNADAAFEIAESIRRAVAQHRFGEIVAGGYRVTVSVGVCAIVPTAGSGSATLVQSADAALYQAKRLGRDRTETIAP